MTGQRECVVRTIPACHRAKQPHGDSGRKLRDVLTRAQRKDDWATLHTPAKMLALQAQACPDPDIASQKSHD